MKKSAFNIIALLGFATSISFSSCNTDDEINDCCLGNLINDTVNPIHTPSTYEFTRNGKTTVSFSGQTERLNQLAELKAELLKADKAGTISNKDLRDMFANTSGDGNGNFSFFSTKQLKNKTFSLDQSYFEQLLDSAAHYSTSSNQTTAANGIGGIATRTGNKTILVNKNGQEFTQLIEKGLMGATFYNQIVNSYLTDAKIGDAVNNTDVDSIKNHTDMEHHFDEAFGYLGAPVDFSSNYLGTGIVRYWANYANTSDNEIQLNDRIMKPFRRARAAIEAKDYTVKDEEVTKIYKELEILIAATAIHYANESKAATVDGDRLHVLSECYAFTRSFRYSNATNRKLSQTEVDTLLSYIGSNFWNTTESDLNLLINKLASTYGLETVKNQL